MTLKQLGISTGAPTMESGYRAGVSHIDRYSQNVLDMAYSTTPNVIVPDVQHTGRTGVEAEEAFDADRLCDYPEGGMPRT